MSAAMARKLLILEVQIKGGIVMSEFIFLYRREPEVHAAVSGSPEQMQKTMQKWMTWMKELGEKGHLKNAGHPLEGSGKVVRGQQKTITDGPFAESKDIIGGYSLIEAKDIAHAVELSLGCPILEYGGLVEVRPVMKM
jgi:hypothetical protein